MELKGSLACPTSCPPHCSPGSSAGKECLQCMRPWFESWVRKIPWRRDRLPTPVFLGFPGGSADQESSHNVGDPGLIPGLGNPLEKEKATHSSILAWRIPWTTVSVQFSCSVVSDSLRPHEPQHARPPCPSPTPGVHSTHVHRIGDAIQPSHPLLSPSPPTLNLSEHQGLFQ